MDALKTSKSTYRANVSISKNAGVKPPLRLQLPQRSDSLSLLSPTYQPKSAREVTRSTPGLKSARSITSLKSLVMDRLADRKKNLFNFIQQTHQPRYANQMESRAQHVIAKIKQVGVVVEEMNDFAAEYDIANVEGKHKRTIIQEVLGSKYELYPEQPKNRKFVNLDVNFGPFTPKRKNSATERTSNKITLLKAKNSAQEIFNFDKDGKLSKSSRRARSTHNEVDRKTADSRESSQAIEERTSDRKTPVHQRVHSLQSNSGYITPFSADRNFSASARPKTEQTSAQKLKTLKLPLRGFPKLSLLTSPSEQDRSTSEIKSDRFYLETASRSEREGDINKVLELSKEYLSSIIHEKVTQDRPQTQRKLRADNPRYAMVEFEKKKMPFSLAMIAKARKGFLQDVFSKRKVIDHLPTENTDPEDERKFMKKIKAGEKKVRKNDLQSKKIYSGIYYEILSLNKEARNRVLSRLDQVMPSRSRFFKSDKDNK